MKLCLNFAFFLFAPPVFANHIESRRVFTTAPEREDIPRNFSFHSGNVRIHSPLLFNLIFENATCENVLQPQYLGPMTELTIRAAGAAALELTLVEGMKTHSVIVPAIYYSPSFRNGVIQPAHFHLKLSEHFVVHIHVNTDDDSRSLTISSLQGRRHDRKLVPVAEAH